MSLSEPSAEGMRHIMIGSRDGSEVSTTLRYVHRVPGFGSWEGPALGRRNQVALLRIDEAASTDELSGHQSSPCFFLSGDEASE